MNRNALKSKVSLVLEAAPKDSWYDFQVTRDLKKVINDTLESGRAIIDIVGDIRSISYTRVVQAIGRKMKVGLNRTFHEEFSSVINNLRKDVKASGKRISFVGLPQVKDPEELATWLYAKMGEDPVSALFIVHSMLKTLSSDDPKDADFLKEARLFGRNSVIEHGDLSDETLLGDFHNVVINKLFSSARDGIFTVNNPNVSNQLVSNMVNLLGYQNLISLKAVMMMDQDDFERALKASS